jgi:hypothetical protein
VKVDGRQAVTLGQNTATLRQQVIVSGEDSMDKGSGISITGYEDRKFTQVVCQTENKASRFERTKTKPAPKPNHPRARDYPVHCPVPTQEYER